MFKKATIVTMMLFLFTGCTQVEHKSYETKFTKNNNIYSLVDFEENEGYIETKENLDKVSIEKNKDTKVAALTTSTANILSEAGLNVVAAPQSESLDVKLQEKQKSGEVLNLGSALEPNLEVLMSSGAQITFVSNAMPHSDSYNNIENLISLPQKTYQDIYITLQLLSETFKTNDSVNLINQLAKKDQEAKSYVEGSNKKITNIISLQYTYGQVSINNKNSFIGSMLEELNLNNAFADKADNSLAVNLEEIYALDPEYIVVFAHGGLDEQLNETIAKNEKIKELSAYKNNKIIVLDDITASADLNAADSFLQLTKALYEK